MTSGRYGKSSENEFRVEYDGSIVSAIGMSPSFVCSHWDLQTHIIIMFELLLLKSAIQLLRHDGLNSYSVFSSERVVFAVPIVVHIVGADISANLSVLVHPFQFLPLRIAVVLKRDGVVGQTACVSTYPLLLAVRLMPSI